MHQAIFRDSSRILTQLLPAEMKRAGGREPSNAESEGSIAEVVEASETHFSIASLRALCELQRSTSTILSLGDGRSGVAKQLAAECRQLVAWDSSCEGGGQGGASAWILKEDKVLRLPPGVDSFDCILDECLDGIVFANVRGRLPAAPGEHAEQEASVLLAHCARMLKTSGWLYLEIENRWGFHNLLSRRIDGFSGALRHAFGSTSSGEKSRALSERECIGLALSAGFSAAVAFAVMRGEASAPTLVPTQSSSRGLLGASQYGVVASWKRSIFNHLPLFPRHAPRLAIVCRKTHSTAPWLHELDGCSLLKIMTGTGGASSNTQASIWYRRSDGSLRIREVNQDADLSVLPSLARMRHDVPELGRSFEFFRDWTYVHSGSKVWVDRAAVPGEPLSEIRYEAKTGAQTRLNEVLLELAGVPVPSSVSTMGYLSLFDRWCERSHLVSQSELLELRELCSMLDDTATSTRLVMHGDLTSSNIIVGSDGRYHLIDWEWMQVVSFQGFDTLHLRWRQQSATGAMSPSALLQFVLLSVRDRDAESNFRLVHPGGDWVAAVLGFWLLRVGREVGSNSTHEQFRSWLLMMKSAVRELAKRCLN